MVQRLAGLVAAALGLVASLAPAALATEDTIEIPAGGLLLIPDERVAVEAQEVAVGRASVKASYALRNTGTEPLTRTVAFVLPEIDMNAIGDDVVVLASADPRNPVSAAVTVDGGGIALAFEQRASAFARDLTTILEREGVPLNPLAPDIEARLGSLAAGPLAELEERGAIRRDEQRILPNWSVRTTAYWRQTLEPQRLVTMSLAYQPVTASGIWGAESLSAWRETYCIDPSLETAIAARAARAGRGLVTHRVTFATANEPGWWAAIPSFRLLIEKTGLETLVASCQPSLRAVGPTVLERSDRDYRPGDDIRILFIN